VVSLALTSALVLTGALTPTTVAQAAAAPVREASFDQQMIRLVNLARAEHGLAPVLEAKGLTKLSVWWSTRLASGATGYVLKHNVDAWTMLPRYGAASRTSWGENVAKFSPAAVPAAEILAAYMRSPGHRANILRSGYRYIGMGTMTGSGGTFNTMTFTDKVDDGQDIPAMSAQEAGAIVDRLCRDLLGRPPSVAGRARTIATLRGGTPVRFVAAAIVYSPGHYVREVDAAYRAVLGRPADSGGLARWTDRVGTANGTAQLLGSLLGSSEAYGRAGRSAAGWVRYAFKVLLGRGPTAAELAAWSARLKSRSHTSVATELAGITPALTKRINGLFAKYLSRKTSGTAMVPLARSSGDDAVVLTLVSSAEYRGLIS
jgi:uncharacterized protein YkwD